MSNQGAVKQSYLRRLLLKFNIVLPPLPASPPAHQPSDLILFQLAALIAVAVIFHFFIAELIVATFVLFVFLIKFALIVRKNKSGSSLVSPPQTIIVLLTIVSTGLIVLFYGGWNGQRSGISFLASLASLKFLESRTLRDYYVVCLILYFLAASSFLFNSSIINIAMVLIYTLAITATMLSLSSPSTITNKTALTSASSVITKALPLALILFFFFPRIHGSFGFLPSHDRNQFDNALNNSLVAGDIASSAFNNALAFRVEFDGAIPRSSALYWRSKVMPIENNFTWEVRPPSSRTLRDAQIKQAGLGQRASQPDLTRYTVLHEESSDLFLPFLDYVAEFSRGRFNADFSIWQRIRNNSFSYRGGSTLGTSIAETLPLDAKQFLQTTSLPSARTQALLARWRQQTSDPIKLAQTVLDYFTTNEFYYSLYPPALGDDPVDDFLFNSKTGYCEHYASVFSILMRWLGVPTRIVAGYQGGLANQTGEYLEIRYSDAHAWTEILVDQTWIRVDPTAAISPERIEFGMQAFMSLWESGGVNGYSDGYALSNYLNPTGITRYYRLLRDNWNNIGYQWKKWIIDYDADTQQELLAKLGFEGKQRYAVLIIIMFTCLGAVLMFYFWRLLPKHIKHAEDQRLYLKFVNRFKHAKVIKEPADTPLEFADKAITKFPHLQQEISELTNAYIQLRYGKNSFELNKFKQLVKQFKLKTNT